MQQYFTSGGEKTIKKSVGYFSTFCLFICLASTCKLKAKLKSAKEYNSLQVPPPVPLRPPAVPKRTHAPNSNPPPVLPPPRSRALPPVPTADAKPRPPARNPTHLDSSTLINNTFVKRAHDSHKQPPHAKQGSFEYGAGAEFGKLPPAPVGPPPPAPKATHKPAPAVNKATQSQQYNTGKVSVRQDSSVSSDSFSQTSSPSYTTKTMETPLLPPRTPIKQNGVLKTQPVDEDTNGNATITKSVSTPASLQTIVRFHNGSNMSLHHRVSGSSCFLMMCLTTSYILDN